MIPVDDLKDGQPYHGHCRNASIAIWNAKRRLFIYIREKFGGLCVEGATHKDEHIPDDGDYFVPERLTTMENALKDFGTECMQAIKFQTEPR